MVGVVVVARPKGAKFSVVPVSPLGAKFSVVSASPLSFRQFGKTIGNL